MQNGQDSVARAARVVRLDRKFRRPGGRHVAAVLSARVMPRDDVLELINKERNT